MNYLEMVGTLVGLVYLWLEYRASIYLWVTGVIMPAIYIVVYYRAGLYADFGINIYYLVAALYGWLMWRRKRGAREETATPPIIHFPLRLVLPVAALTALLTVGIAFILIRFTDSNVPWMDGLTTAMSIVGLWMLARKHAEQWLVWIVVDAIYVGLYIYKGLMFTSALYAVYTVIAFLGYRKWLQLMKTL